MVGRLDGEDETQGSTCTDSLSLGWVRPEEL